MLMPLLLAQEAAKQPASDPLFSIMLFALPLVLLYFVVFRPVRKQENQRKLMIAALKKNDEVIAGGGIIGTVVGIKEKAGGIAGDEDEILLRVDDKTRLRVIRSSIVRVLPADSGDRSKDKEPTETAAR